MKKVFVLTLFFVLLTGAVSFAAGPKTYQVTGPVLEVTDTLIVVQKGKKSKWEIARNANTKLPVELKVGDNVKIEYTMTASSVEAKEAKKKSSKSK